MRLGLSAIAAPGSQIDMRAIPASVEGNRATYVEGNVQEVFVNGPQGIEQRFLVRSSIAAGAETLDLLLSASPGMRVSLSANGRDAVLSTSAGPAFRYGGLLATDALGRRLPAKMRLRDGQLVLAVNTERARFPVSIDPLLAPYETLVGPPQPTSRFASSVAISADGETVAIGGEGDDEGRGSAWIFARTGDSLVQVGAKLTPRPQRFNAASGRSLRVTNFGARLALSADGDTLLVGDNPLDGPLAAWVFTRVDGTWRQQGPALTPSGPLEAGSNNAAVALSGNGDTAVLDDATSAQQYEVVTFVRSGGHWRGHGPPLLSSAPPALSGDGRTLLLGTLVFGRTRSGWRQTARLGDLAHNESASNATLSGDGNDALIATSAISSDEIHKSAFLFYERTTSGWRKLQRMSAADTFGESVSLSSDGTTAVIGAPQGRLVPTGTTGFASVFTRASATDWVQAATLPGLEGPVALASDGSMVFAAPGNETGAPAKIFTRSGTGWTEQDSAADPNGATGIDAPFGESFAVSADADTVVVGEYHAASVFVRSGQAWSRQAQLQLEGAVGGNTLVALSADGNTAVLAGPSSPGPVAAWVFTRSDGVWSTGGTPLIATGASPHPPGELSEPEGFASSVAVSANGNVVLIGADWDSAHQGATWIFTRAGASWEQQGSKLTAVHPSPEERFGDSVALSENGETALVGAEFNTESSTELVERPGAGYILTESGGVWTQTAKLLEEEHSRFATIRDLGSSVALSASGETALLGASEHALIFTKTSSGWRQHRPALTAAADEHNAVYGGKNAFGSVVSLSADGATALIGSPAREGCGKYDDQPCSLTSTVWAFARRGEAWVREPLPLVHDVPFGSPVALDGDGEIALVNGVTNGPEPGGAVFVSSLTAPPQSGFVIEPPSISYEGQFDVGVWSLLPTKYVAVARILLPHAGSGSHARASMLYAKTNVGGSENVGLDLVPRRSARRYLERHRHARVSVTISATPLTQAPTSKRTIMITVPFVEPFSPEG
jgi:hypothetical protein